MSYDLIGYRARPGESPEDAVERLEELAAADTRPGDAEWAVIARIGAELASIDPTAQLHSQREGGFAQISTDRFQVSVHEHEAALTMPYWSDGSDEPWAAIAAYLDVLGRAGFTIFDPQTEQVVGDDVAAQVSSGYRESAATVLPALEKLRSGGPTTPRRWPFGRRKKDS